MYYGLIASIQSLLLIDEMSIKACLEYNKSLDFIEGYEDLGHLGRSEKSAKLVLVVMIRGLHNKWKLPFAYFISSTGVTGDQMANIARSSIVKLCEIGFSPSIITCDQGTSNRKMFSMLGGTPENPYTVINSKKIFLMYDIPHLMKSIRNNLLTGNIILTTNEGEKKICFNDFRETYKIDSCSKTTRAMCKIDQRHLYPNPWQKMSCKLALQVFSNTVSAAIKTAIETGELISSTAQDTANFFLQLNNLFDVLNSKNLYDKNPYKKPLSERNLKGLSIIYEALEMFKNIKKQCFKNQSNTKNNIPPCFTGFVWSLNAVLQLYEHEKSTNPSPTKFFLLTNRLCQDALENLFSIFRQRCGYNRNPTSKSFRCGFASICSFCLLNCASEKSNCEDDEDNFLTPEILTDLLIDDTPKDKDVDVPKTTFIASSSEGYDSSSDSEDTSYDCTENKSLPMSSLSLEKCSLEYYAGYLGMKCFKKFQCNECYYQLISTNKSLVDKDQLFILHKTFDHIEWTSIDMGLKAPTKELVDFVYESLKVFQNNYENIKWKKNLVSSLINMAEKKIKNSLLENICQKEKKFILNNLFSIRIYKECKWSMDNVKNINKGKQNSKLSILQHK
ncbi:unnamed protein product [Aphis gossypii]|uniref:Transposable element P transposase n=1 Tax=Aphis gossypii TaxID=80765 RepID=A0A9P0J7H9_APHGO|nr:unnamed protein product [Aphis gossypii]